MFGKKFNKDVQGMVVGGTGLALGSQVAGSFGATRVQQGLGNISKRMSVAGNIMGSGQVLDALGNLTKKKY